MPKYSRNPVTPLDLEDEDETAEERDARLLESLKSSSSHGQVTLNDEKQLVWPVRLLYPEYATSDIIQQFSEVFSRLQFAGLDPSLHDIF